MVSHSTSNISSGKKASDTPLSDAGLSVSFAVRSDVGCERDANEDRCLVFKAQAGHGFFVFDGMGGELGGAAAAEISAQAIEAFFAHTNASSDCALMEQAISLAHSNVKNLRKTSKMKSMGTTTVGAIVSHDGVCIGSVGDSRAYRISTESIEQLTHDHTVVQTMVDRGEIAFEDAMVHPYSHVLTRCLGSEDGFGIDSLYFFIDRSHEARGDKLLLCSDGLYSLVSEDELKELVSVNTPEIAADKLIALARERGGFDNISAIVIDIGGVLCTEIPTEVLPEEAQEFSEASTITESFSMAKKSSQSRGLIRSFVLFLLVAGCFAVLSMGAVLFLRR